MANEIINSPPIRSTLNDGGGPARPWSAWFSQVYTLLFALGQSGTTANRPTQGLWTGRTYFDTTLGIPIWYDGAGWIDATGASV